MDVIWLFNGKDIRLQNPDVEITALNKHMSAISIESITAKHAGEYTCVAINKAGNVSHSAVLAVNGTLLHNCSLFRAR